MRKVVIVDGVRTPLIKAGTQFASLSAAELGTIVLRELLWRLSLRGTDVDEVIVGTGAQAPDSANPAKIIAERAGLASEGFSRIPAYTVQRNCASGMEAISAAFKDIALSRRDIVAVIGVESMSRFDIPYSPHLKRLWENLIQTKTASQKLKAYGKLWLETQKQMLGVLQGKRDALPKFGVELGLTDSLIGMLMGQTADVLAREFCISREEQDHFALQSHQRASAAVKSGRLAEEIVPVFVSELGKFIGEDNGIRHNQTPEALAKLRPYFDRKFGTVTVGNSSQVTDGAAAIIVAAQDVAQRFKLPVLGEIVDFESVGCEPLRMGLAPALATSKLFSRTGLSMDDVGLVELNEAFAAQVLAVLRIFAGNSELQKKYACPVALKEIDHAKLNVNGGAIALGHPIGATGTRLVLTLLKEMKRRKIAFGLATLCIGGGQGSAMIVKNVDECVRRV